MNWPESRRVERQAKRMHEMMQKRDVNPAELARLRNGEAYMEARERCLRCCATTECLLWLDANPPSSVEPHFCPNIALFDGCRRD
jgi:Family of unknown function (DUF6455)